MHHVDSDMSRQLHFQNYAPVLVNSLSNVHNAATLFVVQASASSALCPPQFADHLLHTVTMHNRQRFHSMENPVDAAGNPFELEMIYSGHALEWHLILSQVIGPK